MTVVDALPGLDPDLRPPLFYEWITADVLEGLRALPAESVDVVVTSPPYWGRRRYTDDDRELGIESLPDYLDRLVEVFIELRRVLRTTGVAWLNIGDTSVGSGGAGGDYNEGGSKFGQRKYKQGDAGGIPKGQWADVPGRLVHRLQESGWYLRMPVVWDKQKPRAESLSHAKRPGEQFEMIYMLTKHRNRYRFFEDRLVDRGNVWSFPVGGGGTGHEAVFPAELVERCLLATSEPGDVLLDPFAGSGTALEAAAAHGRSGLGIDFDPSNVGRAQQRLEGTEPGLRLRSLGRNLR